MRGWFERVETFAIDVILERRYGKRANLLRGILWSLSALTRFGVQLRLTLFKQRIFRPRTMGCLVISVGNLTVGGTGKTPVVEMLARQLQAGGRRVAILSRGYKSVPRPLLKRIYDKLFRSKEIFAPRIVSDGKSLLLDSRTAGDEPFMLANNLRGVVVLVDRDRIKSGLFAIQHFGVDVLLLDDGLQYLKMRHAVEIVLIDRETPFGNEFLLPRGTLREPPEHLQRATHILITKCTGGEDNTALIRRIRRFNRTAEIVECTHRPRHLTNISTGETKSLEFLKGLSIGSLCGIAVPDNFVNFLKNLGATVELSKTYIDHHRYTLKEVETFIRQCSRQGNIQAIITTEKDAVRIPCIVYSKIPIYSLRVEIEILRGDDNWQKFIHRLTSLQRIQVPQKFFQ